MPTGFYGSARQNRGASRTAAAAALVAGLVFGTAAPSIAAAADEPPESGPGATYRAPGQPLTTPVPSRAHDSTTVEKSEEDLRVATLHADLVADEDGGHSAEQLVAALRTGNHARARVIARTVQMNEPDVLVLTGVTYDDAEMVAEHLRSLYLSSGQDGLPGLDYPHMFTADTNSGRESGMDLDGDGTIGGPGDAIGYGDYPGQYGMIVFSKHPIVAEEIRTFQDFLWKDLPDPSIPTAYSELEESILRLQESSLWDVPVEVPGGEEPVHVIATAVASQHSTEAAAARADDIRTVVSDYVSGSAWYLTDDAGRSGGLTPGADAIVAGAPLAEADEPTEALGTLLDSAPLQDPEPQAVTEVPISQRFGSSGGSDETATRYVPDDQDYRASLVLPSSSLTVSNSGIFWPGDGEEGHALVDPSSRYALQDRLVWVDLTTGD